MRTVRLFLILLVALLGLPTLAGAQSVSSGDITVHYSAIPTTTLTPAVARQYGITRSASRALVNIAVRKGKPGADVAVPSRVTATVTNLNGQRQEMTLREVKEGDAVYYLGETRINGNETLTFEIEVRPQGRSEPIRASFRQEFFVH
ncbi:DUF4426 domain-containing protein [Arenimonas oryziterrae]|uniref:DUF4426 domain-containing protein n=1 Tax=Arenimonas oryziterrae DSM 21050 = YC6267 TaxID=1121015 RepID=A0A091ATD1_9GAMM|nr:DUF4426 domain-containing protein [Arenimonas oryziterrae]KFN43428.1 hypothetical protein N789_09135 [Arenimonas oryziterrae DSM 21050 = YC6267]